MPSKATQLKLHSLQTRCNKLAAQADALAAAQASLLHRQQLLHELCESFALYQVSKGAQEAAEGTDGSGSQRLNELLQKESCLLQQLRLQELALPLPVLPDLGVATIAPRSDPLALFKRIVSMPQLPEACEVTTARVAEVYRHSFMQAALQLQLVTHSPAPSVREQAKADLENSWIRVLHLHMSVLMCGRPEVIEGLNLFNVETMQQDPEAVDRNAAQTAAMPPLLELTPQQLQEISTGTALFSSLLNSIVRERQQLQLQLSVDDSPADAPTSSASSSASSLASMQQALHSCHQDLESHQRETRKIQVLLHKEYALRSAFVGWFVGCLSWTQVTKAVLFSWPYCWRSSLCAQETARYANVTANGSSQDGATRGSGA